MKPKNVKLTVLSRGPSLYSTMRLVYEARRIRWRVRVVNPLALTLHLSDCPQLWLENMVHEPTAVLARIGHSITAQGVSVVRHLELMGTPVINSASSIAVSRNKLEAQQALIQAGIRMPETVYVNGKFDMAQIAKTVGQFPWVIKVVSGTQGAGVLLASTHKEAEAQLEFATASKQPVLVQKFIAEAKGADIRAFVVGDKVVASMKRQASAGEFRSNLHRGGSAKKVALTVQEQETAVKSAKALGLDIAGVDMLPTSSGPLLMEVNSSPGLEGIEKSTGTNVAGAIIEHLHTRLKAKWSGETK